MRQVLTNLRHILSIEDREKSLFSMARYCGKPHDILSYRDFDNGVDIFLVEFDSYEEAHRAKVLMGFSPVADSNIASLIIPSSYLN